MGDEADEYEYVVVEEEDVGTVTAVGAAAADSSSGTWYMGESMVASSDDGHCVSYKGKEAVWKSLRSNNKVTRPASPSNKEYG
jgi:hypothetical protein